MFKHILVPTDGGALSRKAMTAALELAKDLGAKVTAYACVVETLPMTEFAVDTPQVVLDQLHEDAVQHLGEFEASAKNAGIICETATSVEFSPYEGIIRTAEQKGCDLILMASHGRKGLASLLLGSETQKVLTHSSIPVLVYR